MMFFKHIIFAFVASVSIVGAQSSISVKPSGVPAYVHLSQAKLPPTDGYFASRASVPPVFTATVVVVSTDVETSFTTIPSSVTSTDLVTAFASSPHTSTISLVSHSDSTLASFPSSGTVGRLSSTSTGFITAVASASGTRFPSASISTSPINNGAVRVHKGLIPPILASIGGVLLRAALEL